MIETAYTKNVHLLPPSSGEISGSAVARLPPAGVAYAKRIFDAHDKRQRANQEQVQHCENDTALPFADSPSQTLPLIPKLTQEVGHRSEQRIDERSNS